MTILTRQRIKHLVEDGGLYPVEPATRAQVARLAWLLVFLVSLDITLTVLDTLLKRM